MTIEVIASLRFAATHSWPSCTLPHVAYLKHPHRHEFHIKVWKQVSHTDRDTEIIMLKENIEGTLANWFPHRDLGTRSCEDIALRLVERFGLSACEVLEDGENGAKVTA